MDPLSLAKLLFVDKPISRDRLNAYVHANVYALARSFAHSKSFQMQIIKRMETNHYIRYSLFNNINEIRTP